MNKSRRSILRSASTLGFSSIILSGAGHSTAKKDSDKSVTGVRFLKHTNHQSVKQGTAAPERTKKKYSIPFNEWKHKEVRKDIAQRLRKDFDEPELASGIRIKESGDTLEVEPIALYHTRESATGKESSPSMSYQEFVEKVPDSMTGYAQHNGKRYSESGIQIKTYKRRLVEEAYFDDKYRPVPGGCNLSSATLGTPVTDNQYGDKAWVTAAHVVDRESGHSVYQPNYLNKIGESDRYTLPVNGDSAVVRGDTGVSYDIAGSNGSYDYPVFGKVPSSDIEDHAILWKQGSTTGRDYGSVKEVYTTGDGHERVNLDVYTEDGDSGGPYYAREEDNAYIAGIHNGSVYTESGDRLHAYGQTMEDVEQKLYVTV